MRDVDLHQLQDAIEGLESVVAGLPDEGHVVMQVDAARLLLVGALRGLQAIGAGIVAETAERLERQRRVDEMARRYSVSLPTPTPPNGHTPNGRKGAPQT